MRKWLYRKIRDYYCHMWLETGESQYFDSYLKWTKKIHPFLV